MLCLSGFELYSRWVPLWTVLILLITCGWDSQTYSNLLQVILQILSIDTYPNAPATEVIVSVLLVMFFLLLFSYLF